MLLSFLNGILPADLNDGVRTMLHLLVLFHLLVFVGYIIFLVRDLNKSPQKRVQEGIDKLKEKTN